MDRYDWGWSRRAPRPGPGYDSGYGGRGAAGWDDRFSYRRRRRAGYGRYDTPYGGGYGRDYRAGWGGSGLRSPSDGSGGWGYADGARGSRRPSGYDGGGRGARHRGYDRAYYGDFRNRAGGSGPGLYGYSSAFDPFGRQDYTDLPEASPGYYDGYDPELDDEPGGDDSFRHGWGGERMSDADVRESVTRSLGDDGFIDADGIQVEVKDRVVTLRGEVNDYLEARYAWDDAWEAPGVRGVISKLTVAGGSAEGEGVSR